MRAPRSARSLACVLAVALTAAVMLPSAAAAQAGDQTTATLAPELSAVTVEGAAAAEAQAAFDDTLARLTAATTARHAAEAELVSLAARDTELTAAIAAETRRRKAAAAALVVARGEVQEAAVSSYVVSTTTDDVTEVFDLDSTVAIGTVQTYSDTVREDRQRVADAAADEVRRASVALDTAQLERIDVRARTVEVTGARDRAAADEAALTVELQTRTLERDRARATARVGGLDFVLVALDAYWRAAAGQSACGIEWWALAGISRVEGRHGTYGGARLLANGDLTRPIIGIALNGSNDTAVIGDTDGGELDGDPVHDRAVGPMQFIPETWRRWARDGDGDGDADPQNLYDATAAAAAYLCNGRRLDSEAGLRAGYYSYNHSEAYVNAVLSYAYGYRRFTIPAAP